MANQPNTINLPPAKGEVIYQRIVSFEVSRYEFWIAIREFYKVQGDSINPTLKSVDLSRTAVRQINGFVHRSPNGEFNLIDENTPEYEAFVAKIEECAEFFAWSVDFVEKVNTRKVRIVEKGEKEASPSKRSTQFLWVGMAVLYLLELLERVLR